MNLQWRKKVRAFSKSIEDEISRFERDHEFDYDIRLQKVIKITGKLAPQIKRWADVISKLKKYLRIIELEFEQWDAEEFIKTKREMVLEQDERKRTNLKVYPLTDTEVKIRRKADKNRMLSLKEIGKIEAAIQYIDTNHYWIANNTIKLLDIMSRYSVAWEKDYKA